MRKNSAIAFSAACLILAAAIITVAGQGGQPKDVPIWQWMIDTINAPGRLYIDHTLGSIIGGLTQNPRIFCPPADPVCVTDAGVGVLMGQWIRIMIPFYVVAMLLTALFFIIKAGTPRGRARSRSMFLKLLFGMVVVALSPAIYEMLIEISVKLVKIFLRDEITTFDFLLFNITADISPFGDITTKIPMIGHKLAHTGLTMSCIFIYLAVFIFIAAGVVVWLRNLMVFFYGVFFPIIMFLYMFEITKPYGKKWLNSALRWIYVPAFQALVIAFTVNIAEVPLVFVGPALAPTIEAWITNSMTGVVVLAGLFCFTLAPIILTHLMAWLGDAVIAVGLGAGRTWMVAFGGVLAGGGAGAITFAHGEYTRARAYERYMSGMRGAGWVGGSGAVAGGGLMGATGGVSGGAGGGYLTAGGSAGGGRGGAGGGRGGAGGGVSGGGGYGGSRGGSGGGVSGGGGAGGGARGGGYAGGGRGGGEGGYGRGVVGGSTRPAAPDYGPVFGGGSASATAPSGGRDSVKSTSTTESSEGAGGFDRVPTKEEVAQGSPYQQQIKSELDGGSRAPHTTKSKGVVGQERTGKKVKVAEGEPGAGIPSMESYYTEQEQAPKAVMPEPELTGVAPGDVTEELDKAKKDRLTRQDVEADLENKKWDTLADKASNAAYRNAALETLQNKRKIAALTKQEDDLLKRMTDIEEAERRRSGEREHERLHDEGDAEAQRQAEAERKKAADKSKKK